MSQQVRLHAPFRSLKKEGGYELPGSKYLSNQIQPVTALRKYRPNNLFVLFICDYAYD